MFNLGLNEINGYNLYIHSWYSYDQESSEDVFEFLLTKNNYFVNVWKDNRFKEFLKQSFKLNDRGFIDKSKFDNEDSYKITLREYDFYHADLSRKESSQPMIKVYRKTLNNIVTFLKEIK